MPDLAADLAQRQVDVIVVSICGAPLDAARGATKTIPLVVAACNDDLVAAGVVASLARPGGNITGLSKVTPELARKRLETLKAALPQASHVAVLWNPGYSDFSADWREIHGAARRLGVTLQSVEFQSPDDWEPAFDKMAQERADAVITFSDNLAHNYPGRLAEIAARRRFLAMYAFREVPEAGGLMSYGPNILGTFRHAASFVDKILKGAKPATLPIQQPSKFELVINLKTARALDLTIRPSLLLRADRVIEE